MFRQWIQQRKRTASCYLEAMENSNTWGSFRGVKPSVFCICLQSVGTGDIWSISAPNGTEKVLE